MIGEENCGYDESGSVDKLPKSVKYLFECPVCLDFAWPPRKIFQCQEGHIVCEVCYSNTDLQNCPICRIPIREQGQVSRNRQLEELSSALYALEPSSSTSGPPPVSGNAILAGHQLTGTQLRSGTPILDPNAPSAPPYSSITVAGVENSEAADQRSEDYIEEEGEDTDESEESEEVSIYLSI
ncbi:uncharacterized protein LOC111707735 [Eurytemora carolleeae]|uniref:uncharacterized protein LOC111707735 n=1 Tax=Eurytemora carolleeae TaxID=1294199 RepID=UPI000C766838|nr:uncharacterized protein LOC111707735 [Eurytemora carolleeae]|eukprot:XP_023336641.1 uncharacterized protein LOC111707735 [Eurytemora affinis]